MQTDFDMNQPAQDPESRILQIIHDHFDSLPPTERERRLTDYYAMLDDAVPLPAETLATLQPTQGG